MISSFFKEAYQDLKDTFSITSKDEEVKRNNSIKDKRATAVEGVYQPTKIVKQ